MAIRTFPCLQSLGLGFPNIGPVGTVAASAVGTPPDGYDRLSDNLDTTYWLMSGSTATPSGTFIAVDSGSFGGPKNQVPGNTAVALATWSVRGALTACANGSLVPYNGTFPAGSQQSVPTSFGAVELPFNLLSFPQDVTSFFNGVYGLVVQQDCDSGGTTDVALAEAVMTVDFDIPTPIIETLPIGDVSPRDGILRGSLVVNQQQIEDGGANGRFSHEFPVTARFELGPAPDALVPVGDTLGPFYGTVPGNNFANPYFASIALNQGVDLEPNTIYFFRVTATTEDGTVNGDTLSFTSPLTDPIKGVF